MRFYLAARYSRRAEILDYAEKLRASGHVVTSTWLNGEHEHKDRTATDVERAQWATDDISDILRAQAVVCFTEPSKAPSSSGGRHFEAGFAFAHHKVLIVIGPTENVFYCLRGVLQFETWECFLAFMLDTGLTTPSKQSAVQSSAELALESSH